MTDYRKPHPFDQDSGAICRCGFRREDRIHDGFSKTAEHYQASDATHGTDKARAVGESTASNDINWTNLWLGLIFVLLVITNLLGVRIGPVKECEDTGFRVECSDSIGITWGR